MKWVPGYTGSTRRLRSADRTLTNGFIRQSGYSLGEGNGDGDRLGYTDEPVVALLEIGTGAGSRVEAEVELRLAKTAAVVDGVFNAGGRIKLSDWRS